MVTFQRRRGIPAQIWKTVEGLNNRGDKVKHADPTGPHNVAVWLFPQRSAKAEVPGQVIINVTRIGVSANLEGVDAWSRVDMLGKSWDVVTPPSYHHGTRQTRHWSIDLRERP